MDATTRLANLLSRRTAVLLSVGLALAAVLLAVWLSPRVSISVAPTADHGSWMVTVALQPSCSGGPGLLGLLLKPLT